MQISPIQKPYFNRQCRYPKGFIQNFIGYKPPRKIELYAYSFRKGIIIKEILIKLNAYLF